MICKFCGVGTKLIDAHIISKSFFESLFDPRSPPQLAINIAGVFPGRVPSRIYDKTISCASCEKEYMKYDGCAHEILLKDIDDSNYVLRNRERIGSKLKVLIGNN